MLKTSWIRAAIACAGCVAAVGSAQAATTLTPIANYQGNMSWQNIAGTSYTWADANHDGKINVGEKVTFAVDMHKTNWGTHDFDALKVWIDAAPIVPGVQSLYTQNFEWHYGDSISDENVKWFNKSGDPYSWKPWMDGDKVFTFDYTFTTAGTFDLTAGVMCSRDLSGLLGAADDKPTAEDWAKWGENELIHQQQGWRQGETERYQLTVSAPVPEPETYAMMMAGLGLIGALARRRKAKQ